VTSWSIHSLRVAVRVSAMLPLLSLGCAEEEAPPPARCEEKCKDAVAVRALREMVKFAYNATLQGNPIGPQDETIPCPLGGQARVFGEATANTDQGANEVSLTYVLEQCHYLFREDEEPAKSFNLTFNGELHQQGTLAVQPTARMALVMMSASLTASGTVYDPPLDFSAEACVIDLEQDENDLFGEICGRSVDTHL
jgi:hypothetical protein